MVVDGINPLDGMKPTESRIEEQEVRPAPKPGTEKAPEGDTVEVSSESEVSRFTEEIEKLDEVRTEQVEALKNSIAKGNYSIPSEEIAAKMLDELV